MNTHPARPAAVGPAQSGPSSLSPTSSAGRHQGRSVRTEHAPGSLQPRAGTQCAATQTTFWSGFDLSAPVPVNRPLPDWRPITSQLPQPYSRPPLVPDPWLTQDACLPGAIASVTAQLQRRRQLIAQGQGATFSFSPLVTTLENMHRFVCHIRDGEQFDLALDRQEDQALAWLEERVSLVLQLGAPYQATVKLAMAFVSVYEALTARRVLDPLERQQPVLFSRYAARARDPVRLERLTACRWRGDDSDRTQTFDPSCLLSVRDHCHFDRYLKDLDILLYPSFDLPDLEAACGLGHLPVHPIGMLTTWARAAGSHQLLSPLGVARESLLCAFRQAAIRHPPRPACMSLAQWQLCSAAGRLSWRQLYLDLQAGNRPVKSPAFGCWKPARVLLLFQLFHELGPIEAADYLEKGYRSFLGCLGKLAEARRQKRAEYPADFEQVTDAQAAMAALWSTRLWGHWQACGFELTPAQLRFHACQFMAVEQPLLQEHLDFIDRHRGSLRAFFARQCGWHSEADGQHSVVILADSLSRQQSLLLFRSEDPDAGLSNMDNTDLAWFAALRHPDLRDRIEKEIGTPLPADLVLASNRRGQGRP